MTILTQSRRSSFLRTIQRSLTAGVVVFAASNAWAIQQTGGTGGTGTKSAPEINPALLVGAVVLLVGGILIVMSRRRRAAKA